MVSAPQYKTNAGGMTATSCRSICSKQGLPWTGLTGNSKRNVRFAGVFQPLTMLHSRLQIASAAKTRFTGLFNPWKLVHGSVPVSRLSLSLAITLLNPFTCYEGNATEFCGSAGQLSIYASSGGTPQRRDNYEESEHYPQGRGYMEHVRDERVMRMGKLRKRHA